MTPSEAIAALKLAGLTEKVIAAAVGVHQTTINRIARGLTQPDYTLGKCLVDMALAQRGDGLASAEGLAA